MKKLLICLVVLFFLTAFAWGTYEEANREADKADPFGKARSSLTEQLEKAKREGDRITVAIPYVLTVGQERPLWLHHWKTSSRI